MEVHRELGFGFLEVVYKDAIEYELKLKNIPYEREKLCTIRYKDIILKRTFNADFFIFDKVMLEVKAQRDFAEDNFGQTLNYLSASDNLRHFFSKVNLTAGKICSHLICSHL